MAEISADNLLAGLQGAPLPCWSIRRDEKDEHALVTQDHIRFRNTLMKNHYSIEMDAPPEKVFYWLDDPQRVMKWLPNLIEHEDLEVTADRVGTTFRQAFDEKGRRMEMTGVVTAYEKDRRYACEISGSAFDLMVDYKLEDLGGRTRVTQDSEARFKGLFKIVGLIMIPFAKRSSKKHLDESFGKWKSLAEGSDGEPDEN